MSKTTESFMYLQGNLCCVRDCISPPAALTHKGCEARQAHLDTQAFLFCVIPFQSTEATQHLGRNFEV